MRGLVTAGTLPGAFPAVPSSLSPDSQPDSSTHTFSRPNPYGGREEARLGSGHEVSSLSPGITGWMTLEVLFPCSVLDFLPRKHAGGITAPSKSPRSKELRFEVVVPTGGVSGALGAGCRELLSRAARAAVGQRRRPASAHSVPGTRGL